MPDIWAFCDRCARWFYCSKSERGGELACPACAAPAQLTREGRPERATEDPAAQRADS